MPYTLEGERRHVDVVLRGPAQDTAHACIQRFGKPVAKSEAVDLRELSRPRGTCLDDGLDRLVCEDAIDGDGGKCRPERFAEVVGGVLAGVMTVPRPLTLVQAPDAIRRRDQGRTVRLQDPPNLPEPGLRVQEVCDDLEGDDEIECAIRRRDRRAVVDVDLRSVLRGGMLDHLGVDLQAKVFRAFHVQERRSIAFAESQVEHAATRAHTPRRMVVRIQMEQRNSPLVGRAGGVGNESVRSRSQREGGALLIGSDASHQ